MNFTNSSFIIQLFHFFTFEFLIFYTYIYHTIIIISIYYFSYSFHNWPICIELFLFILYVFILSNRWYNLIYLRKSWHIIQLYLFIVIIIIRYLIQLLFICHILFESCFFFNNNTCSYLFWITIIDITNG